VRSGVWADYGFSLAASSAFVSLGVIGREWRFREHSPLRRGAWFIDGRLYSNNPRGASIVGRGDITSSKNTIDMVLDGDTEYSLLINSRIRDNGHKVGLRISSEGEKKQVIMGGGSGNTFTGDVELSNTYLGLRKGDGVVAIKGNVFVNRSAILTFDSSHQLDRSSVVALKGGRLRFGSWGGDVTQSFKQLTVDSFGIISFGHENKPTAIKKLYLDDLLVRSSGELRVVGWAEGRDFILVKKTSKNLEAALKKMKFEGYDPSKIHLEDYNSEYWMINGAPEPATYGAGLMLAVLGLVRYRRRQKQRFPLRVGRRSVTASI